MRWKCTECGRLLDAVIKPIKGKRYSYCPHCRKVTYQIPYYI